MNMNQAPSLQQSAQPERSLTSALARLEGIAVRLGGANGDARRFLDALVGPEPTGGSSNVGSSQIQSNCFVSDLHRLIDSLDSRVYSAEAIALDLLKAASGYKDDGSIHAKAGLVGRGAGVLDAQTRMEMRHATFGHAASLG